MRRGGEGRRKAEVREGRDGRGGGGETDRCQQGRKGGAWQIRGRSEMIGGGGSRGGGKGGRKGRGRKETTAGEVVTQIGAGGGGGCLRRSPPFVGVGDRDGFGLRFFFFGFQFFPDFWSLREFRWYSGNAWNLGNRRS